MEAGYTRAIRAQMDEVIKNCKRVIAAIEVESVPAMHYALEPIYDNSQVLCPVDKGPLKVSGYLEVRRFRGKISGEIGYAKGGSPHYAVYVHERMDLHHEWPTQAKFLEEPAMRFMDQVPERYAEYVKRSLGL